MFSKIYRTLPEAWIDSLKTVYEDGVLVPTEYGVDAKCINGYAIEITNYREEWHKNDPFCTTNTVGAYKQQLSRSMLGKNNFDYTYIDRLAAYGSEGLDQLEFMREKAREPCSRRVQGITIIPDIDTKKEYIPCLQRVWTYTWPDKTVDLHIHYRSHDLFKAYQANIIAITNMVNVEIIMPNGLLLNRIRLFDDNIHIYADDFNAVERVLKTCRGSRVALC